MRALWIQDSLAQLRPLVRIPPPAVRRQVAEVGLGAGVGVAAEVAAEGLAAVQPAHEGVDVGLAAGAADGAQLTQVDDLGVGGGGGEGEGGGGGKGAGGSSWLDPLGDVVMMVTAMVVLERSIERPNPPHPGQATLAGLVITKGTPNWHKITPRKHVQVCPPPPTHAPARGHPQSRQCRWPGVRPTHPLARTRPHPHACTHHTHARAHVPAHVRVHAGARTRAHMHAHARTLVRTCTGSSPGSGSASGCTTRSRGMPLLLSSSAVWGNVLSVERSRRGLALPQSRT